MREAADGALFDGGCDALYGAMAKVCGDEYASSDLISKGYGIRLSFDQLSRGASVTTSSPRQEKSMLVAPEPPFEAHRDRPCPDEQEHRICSYRLRIPRVRWLRRMTLRMWT